MYIFHYLSAKQQVLALDLETDYYFLSVAQMRILQIFFLLYTKNSDEKGAFTMKTYVRTNLKRDQGVLDFRLADVEEDPAVDVSVRRGKNRYYDIIRKLKYKPANLY